MQPKEQEIPILTVSQLTRSIKRQLEQQFRVVFLQGEISNSKLHTSGHFYFSLKDAEAQIAAVMFRGASTKFSRMPKDGDQVMVRGELTVYPPSGRYQLIVQDMKPVGVGELLQRLEELKRMLHQRGWFDAKHKKPIPKLPKRIGVVTSPTGAAIQDILNVLKRRFAGFHLIINPVRVQGETAAGEIAQAIAQFNQYGLVDVMIVGRGGGSIEDLWAFNELVVAEAIFNSRIPIISAVGHETDHTIADYVADVRAPTPSAAAEMVIAEQTEQIKHLSQITHRLENVMRHHLEVRRHQLRGISRLPLFTSPYGLIGPAMQRLDGFHKRLEILKPTTQIKQMRQKLESYTQSIDRSALLKVRHLNRHLDEEGKKKRLTQLTINHLGRIKERFVSLVDALTAADPKQILRKGYAIPFSKKDGSVITSVRQVQKDQQIRMVLADGEIISLITETKQYDRD
jgi:exodeoxyribonuclease VII large subunit